MYVIGTAGHVDHGKSTLVYALTGIDPDRLKEEKERGLTIDLGFAWLTLPSGREVSIVDVPGHERFIKNMLAGVGGIDLAMLVVAADESVMPQTREHLAILDLLQIRRGLVVITKRDLVAPDWLELVKADVEEVLKSTSLEGAPIVAASAVTREGLDELLRNVDSLLEITPPRPDLGRPRLPIDRSFTIAGFGTVVTGTLIDGSLSLGQEAELVLSGKRPRIRGLQSHRKKIQHAMPGNRVAVNLAGVSHEEVQRGEVLTLPGWLKPTLAADARLRLLASLPRPLKHNTEVTFHSGTSEVAARVRLLDADELRPGQEGWVQLRFATPVALVRGDFFVIRSPDATLGGGNVADIQVRRHRRFDVPMLERLRVMQEGSQGDVLLKALETREPAVLGELAQRTNLALEAATAQAEILVSEGRLVVLQEDGLSPDAILYSAQGWSGMARRAQEFLSKYHQQHPLRKGAPKEELRSRLQLPAQPFALALHRLAKAGNVIDEGSWVRLPQHHANPTPPQEKLVHEYMAQLEASPYSPPTDLALNPELLAWLIDEGKVVRVSDTVVFSAKAFEEMVQRVVEHIRTHGKINVAHVRDMFQTSRKYALALMEHLDQRRITRRVGDDRVLY